MRLTLDNGVSSPQTQAMVSRKAKEAEARKAYEAMVETVTPEAVPKKRNPETAKLIQHLRCSPDVVATKPKYTFGTPVNNRLIGREDESRGWSPRWYELQADGTYKEIYGRWAASLTEAVAKTLAKMDMWANFNQPPDPRT